MLSDLAGRKLWSGPSGQTSNTDTTDSATFVFSSLVTTTGTITANETATVHEEGTYSNGSYSLSSAVFDTQSMDQRMDRSLVSRRSPAVLSLIFGTVALLLSALGIYGVLAYLVTQRRRELGIRIALGSSAGAIFQLILREGLVLIGAGLLLGGTGAMALRKSLQSQLFGVNATDTLVLAGAVTSLAIVAVLACAWPAVRATRIDPVVALTE